MKNKLKAFTTSVFSLLCPLGMQIIAFAESSSTYSFDMNTAVRQADNTDFIFPVIGIAAGALIVGAVMLIKRHFDKKK